MATKTFSYQRNFGHVTFLLWKADSVFQDFPKIVLYKSCAYITNDELRHPFLWKLLPILYVV